MSSREKILADIRQSLSSKGIASDGGGDGLGQSAARQRLQTHPGGIVPDHASRTKLSSLALFCKKVIASQASVEKVKSYGRIGAASEKYLRQHNLSQRVRMGEDKRLAKLGWNIKFSPEISIGPSYGNDLVCLSHAQGGVSETGTLILISGPDNPTSLNFLPETHIIVVNKKDIKRSYEGIWKVLRQKFGKGNLPRTVNMITGPSRSADIEQTLILGAHGPLRLHIIVVGEES